MRERSWTPAGWRRDRGSGRGVSVVVEQVAVVDVSFRRAGDGAVGDPPVPVRPRSSRRWHRPPTAGVAPGSGPTRRSARDRSRASPADQVAQDQQRHRVSGQDVVEPRSHLTSREALDPATGRQLQRGVAPAAARLQADRQPGGDGDRRRRGRRRATWSAAGPSAPTGAVGREQVGLGRVAAAAPDGSRGASRARRHRRPRGRGRRSPPARAAASPADVEVDRSPVVGVDEALLPQLAALVDVGHAGHRQRDAAWRRGRCSSPGPATRATTASSTSRTAGSSNAASTARVHGRLVGLVRVGPGGAVARLAHRLLGVGVEALARRRPGADDGLPEQVAEAGVGHRGER